MDFDAIEARCKIKNVHVSVPRESQLFCSNVALGHGGNFGDFIDAAKILTHTPFGRHILYDGGMCIWLWPSWHLELSWYVVITALVVDFMFQLLDA